MPTNTFQIMKQLLFLLLLIPAFCISQHKISGTFSPPENYSFAFLYKATPLSTEFVTRSEIDSTGNFSFEIDTLAQPGIYKVVYAMPPEKYNFNIIYDGKEDINLTFSEEKGLEFKESNENKLWASYTKSLDLINSTISNYYTKQSKDKEAFNEIFKALSDFQNAYESNSEDLMVNDLIKANRPYIPMKYEDVSAYAKNLKENYLENIDFENPLLQSSDFISDRVMTYMFGVSDNTDDDFYEGQLKTLNGLLKKAEPTVKIAILLPVWQRFRDLSNDGMANYMIDEYLMEIAKKSDQELLIETFEDFKNTSIGRKAHDFEIALADGTKTSLYELMDSTKYLVIFWSSTCSHCLVEMPKVKEFLQNHKKVKVIAYGLEDDKKHWEEEILKYPEFIHVIGLDKWDNKDAIAYAIDATPSFFLLNQDKEIIAKPEDAEALNKLLEEN
ncbi:Thioredoxin-like [Flavobacteriaceae bacterium MAR_2010_188]|nr:Thioredoxin-like [Flavobacteriaceae bacterium MAR_2010_188]